MRAQRATMTVYLISLFLTGCADVDSAQTKYYKPTALSFELQPESGVKVGDLMTCDAVFEDIEGKGLRPQYQWTNLATEEMLSEEPELLWESIYGEPGDMIECLAFAKDSRNRRAEITGELPVLNSPPKIDLISIEPTEIFNDTLVGCTASATDPDADENIAIEYRWDNLTRETELSAGENINLHPDLVSPEEEIACIATATDSNGEITEERIVTKVSNREPFVPLVLITPANPTILDSLVCSAVDAEDPDRDSVTLHYDWFVDGIATTSNSEIHLGEAEPGQEVICQVTPDDNRGLDTGSPTMASVTIENTPPTPPTTVVLTPDPASDNDDLNCIAEGAEDPEGLSLTLDYTWMRNGLVWQGTPLNDGVRVPASATEQNDVWSCIVTASDGYDQSQAIESNSITIGFSCFYGACDDAISLGGGLGIDMVSVAGSQFSMGSPISEDGRDSDETMHLVTLSNDRLISSTEITQDTFQAIMGYLPAGNNGCGDCPVVNLSWHNAAAFTNFLSLSEGLGQCYVCNFNGGLSCEFSQNYPNVQNCLGYRLPTESEYEFALRAGTNGHFWTPNGGSDYASNEDSVCLPVELGNGLYLSDTTQWCENANTIQPVAQLMPNAWGLYDMAGNAAEWVHDRYGLYPLGQSIDPNGAVGGNLGVLRGGDSMSFPIDLRAANRIPAALGQQQPYGGFRIARSLP